MDKGDMGGSSPQGRRTELVEALCREHESQLLQYLTRMLGRGDVAREVLQDTYERIHKLYRPEDVLFPRAMLYKIATNFALMRLRRARLESTIITGSAGMEQVPDEAAAPDKRAMAEEINERLVQTIKGLPPNQRAVLIMAHVQGVARKDIAEQLGISLKRVDKRMTKALRTLRERMESFGIDLLHVD
ncbi:MAG TPA: RNA polymerase sigma factor [Steroidobacteraceae bacterium]|nr:RNA polymerase sigma factor [Steroidobacteraceae bacterium]